MARILVADDDRAVAEFVRRALAHHGHDVTVVEDGLAALHALETADPFELLLTDIVMPQMDGTQLIKHVRETRGDLKVICISGYAEEAFRKRLDNLENIHFLPKPFSLDQLAGKVKEVMR